MRGVLNMGPDNPAAVEKTKKLLERINRVIENRKMLIISKNYQDAVQTYFKGLNYANAVMLTNPLYYFFVKNGQLRCNYSFSYKNGKSSLLSPQTIPSFLRYYFNLEGRRTPERDAFFTALRDYIDCFYQPQFSADPMENYVLTPDGNLYTPLRRDTHFAYLPLNAAPPSNLQAKTKRFFSKAVRSPDPKRVIESPYHFQNSVLYHSVQGHYHQVTYSPETGSFSVREYDRLLFGTKFLRFTDPKLPLSPQGSSLLSSLTGDSAALADQLFRLFARILDPTPGVTILYTKLNKSFLIRFFQRLFWAELCRLSFRPDPKAPSELPSLNQICRNALLWELYDQQAKGASLLLLRDLFPSDSKYAAARALVYGKPLTLTCPWLPDQTFRNHMHLLLFSSEKGEAAYLRRALNAHLIDLAGRECDCSDYPPPSVADCTWLRTQGVLYGLMLNNGYKLPRPKAEPKPSMVEAFFTKHCFFHPLSYCDGRSMYAAYVDYYRVLRDGRNPPIGKIQFIKEARELIENGALGKVKYKKCRRPKDTPPRWYFLGVDRPIRETPPQPPTVIDERVRRIHEMVIPPLNHDLSFPEVKIVTVPSL